MIKKWFLTRKKREEYFLTRINELLLSDNGTLETKEILHNAKSISQEQDFAFAQLYIKQKFQEIKYTPGKKLSDDELKLLNEVSYSKDAIWAARQNTPWRSPKISIDKIKEEISRSEAEMDSQQSQSGKDRNGASSEDFGGN